MDELDIDEQTKSTLFSNIKRRLTPQAVKIRADIEVACYSYEGIDAVKNALLAGLKCCTEEIPIKVLPNPVTPLTHTDPFRTPLAGISSLPLVIVKDDFILYVFQ